jgi:hypothetical protein
MAVVALGGKALLRCGEPPEAANQAPAARDRGRVAPLFLVGILAVALGLVMVFLPGVGLISLYCEESAGSVSTKVIVYQNGKPAEGKYSLSDARAASLNLRAVVWISLVEPSKGELDSVARRFGLQDLEQEETETRKGVILNYQGRSLTLMGSPARYLDDSGIVEIGELEVSVVSG